MAFKYSFLTLVTHMQKASDYFVCIFCKSQQSLAGFFFKKKLGILITFSFKKGLSLTTQHRSTEPLVQLQI